MDVKFPFENVGKCSFGQILRPIAKVTLISPQTNKAINIWMIVDTGADYTILPRYFSTKLGISLERECNKETTYGVRGEQTVYFSKIKVRARIGNLERKIPFAFLDSNEIPALLGRLGFLETFNTKFLKTHHVVFKD